MCGLCDRKEVCVLKLKLAGNEESLTRHRDLQKFNSGQRGKERKKNRQD